MELSDLPGITIDVPLVLQALGKTAASNAVRCVVAEKDTRCPARPAPIKARGVSIDVVELLKSLENEELLSVVQRGLDPWKDVKLQLLQDLHNFLESRPSSSKSTETALTSDSAFAINITSVADQTKLPPIGPSSERRAPEQALANAGRLKPPRPGKAGMSGSRSTPCLPQVPKHGDPSEACSERDARRLAERLRHAVQKKDVPSVQSLLVARANTDQKDKDGTNATSLAMLQGTPHSILKTILEARADVHTIDGQSRSLAHLWAWSLPKTKHGVREAQKKLTLLVKFRADLNARLPVTGDTPLHILSRVYNTLSVHASDGADGDIKVVAELGQSDAENFRKCTQARILLMTGAGASTSVRNGEGKKPFSLIEQRFRFVLPERFQPILEEDSNIDMPETNSSDWYLSLSGKSRLIELNEQTSPSCLD